MRRGFSAPLLSWPVMPVISACGCPPSLSQVSPAELPPASSDLMSSVMQGTSLPCSDLLALSMPEAHTLMLKQPQLQALTSQGCA